MNYLSLNDLECYRLALDLSNYVWDIVIKWDSFTKYTIGQQYVDSTDSISANIAEGFGRYTKRDKIKFYQISKGSLSEITDWTNKAIKRKLLSKDQIEHIIDVINKLPKSINSLVKFTNEKLTI